MSNLIMRWLVPSFSVFMLLFTAFIAMPDGDPAVTSLFSSVTDLVSPPSQDGEDFEFTNGQDFPRELPEWRSDARWFRSNAGGMAIEEIPSRIAALRHEYALVIDNAEKYELPEYLLPYYDEEFFIEVRRLYENGKETRMQWIFKDDAGLTRLIAAFSEVESENKGAVYEVDVEAEEESQLEETSEYAGTHPDFVPYEHNEIAEATVEEELVEIAEIEETENNENNAVIYENFKKIDKNGFIEIFNEDGYIITEYRFQHEGEVSKIIYNYKGAFMIDSAAFLWEENDIGGRFSEIHRDSYRYNRSSFLRAIDRVYLKDQKITQSDPVRITFPGNILNTARNDSFMGEKLHAYPEFFGDLFVQKNSRMVFTTDQRGRVITQTLYSDDEESRVIWTIVNTWAGDRIASTQKTEGDVVLISEYEYDSKDNRILERNIKNGVIERVVRTEGKKDIEELYFNNVIVLRAVYEDGRKISETRVRNN